MSKKTLRTRSVLQSFKIIRKKLVEFAARALGISHLDKESPTYEDMEEILERKKSGRLKFYTHNKIWNR